MRPLAVLAALAAPAATGCFVNTQRLPQPMTAQVDPLPPGTIDTHPEGPEEVLVLRLADPARVRPAGLPSSYPLSFFRKQVRLNSGSWVECGNGGRLEVLWPNTASVVLYGKGMGVVGSPSRGEPMFALREVERGSVTLVEGGRIELLGGALLSASTGPFVLEHDRPEILRVRNRSKGTGYIAFREEVFTLDPGHVIDLPLLEAGGTPLPVDPGFQTVENGAIAVQLKGGVGVLPSAEGVRVRADGANEVRGLGVRVRLEPGEEATFGSLDPPATDKDIEPPQPAEPATPPTAEPASSPGAGAGMEPR